MANNNQWETVFDAELVIFLTSDASHPMRKQQWCGVTVKIHTYQLLTNPDTNRQMRFSFDGDNDGELLTMTMLLQMLLQQNMVESAKNSNI